MSLLIDLTSNRYLYIVSLSPIILINEILEFIAFIVKISTTSEAEFELIGLTKYGKFMKTLANLNSSSNTEQYNKSLLIKKLDQDMKYIEDIFLQEDFIQERLDIDHKVYLLKNLKPELNFRMGYQTSSVSLKIFNFYRMAYMSFSNIISLLYQCYNEFQEIITGS